MNQRIRYAANGDRTYEIDGKEVSEERYNLLTKHEKQRLADMFSDQCPPHGVSDCTFMAGTANGRQFQGRDHIGDFYRQVAEEHGQNITGKKYVSGLAAFPGDPEAWVESRGDVQKVLEKRGWGSEGTVNVKKRESFEAPKPGPDVADDILDKYTNQIADMQPMAHLVDREDLREQVRERIKPKRKPAVTKADA